MIYFDRPRSFGTEAYKVCGVILCSSGTTALSKGTMLSHSQCMVMSRAWPMSHPTFLCFSSLYWLSGFTGLMQSLSCNIKRIMTKRPFRPLTMVHLIEQYKVNVLITPPSQIAMLLQSPVIKLADLSSVRMQIVAGGFIDESLRKAMQEQLLYGAVLVSYGMTEVAGIIAVTAPFQPFTNSSGKITPNFKLKVSMIRRYIFH
jgi:4-coumarate--CoA ligase